MKQNIKPSTHITNASTHPEEPGGGVGALA
jgi:hypothetical protein